MKNGISDRSPHQVTTGGALDGTAGVATPGGTSVKTAGVEAG